MVQELMATLQSKDANKIVVLGLAESGKSTIINAVTDGTIPERGARYSATMNYERKTTTVLGKKLTLFDLGGQTSFLDRFTGELAEFVFSGVKAFIFVTDVTKFEEVSRAKYYLDLCLKNVDKYSPKSLKYIFLHKIDLVLESKQNEIYENMKEFLLSDYTGQINFHTTSIYSDKLFEVMGKIYSSLSGDYKSIDALLENFIQENSKIISFGQIYSTDGQPKTKIASITPLANSSINDFIHTANVLVQQLTQLKNVNPLGITVEIDDEIFFIRFTLNKFITILAFFKKQMDQEKESISLLTNKINAFSLQLKNFSENNK